MTQSSRPSADHARHDRLLVVRYLDLDDELLASEVSQARALLASCPDCAALATELQLISDSTSRMVLPSRPRDFRLTPQQAAALQPGGLRRRLGAAAGAFRFEFLRPVAGVAMAVGLLLAVVGALPQASPVSPSADFGAAASSERAGSAPEATAGPFTTASAPLANVDAQPTAAPVPYPSAAPQIATQTTTGPAAVGTAKAAVTAPASAGGTEPRTQPPATGASPAATGGDTAVVGPGGTPEVAGLPPQQGTPGGAVSSAPGQPTSTVSPLLILGLLLAGVGLLVLLLTFVARRIARSAG